MIRFSLARSPSLASLLVAGCGLVGACSEPPESGGEFPAGVPVVVSLPTRVEPEFERVVLVTIDTLRADHVSSYGYPRQTTPFLDSMAARGVRFTRAMAAVSHTAPSHATMLTGVVPAVHGVLQNGGQLADEVTDLGELFGKGGFETAAFLNVTFLSGIAAAFQKISAYATGPDGRSQSGADVVNGALGWLERERKSERFLLWVHLYDPHKWKDLMLESAPGEPIWRGESPPDLLERLAQLHGLPAPAGDEPYHVEWTVQKKNGERLDVSSGESFLRCIEAYDELTLFADRQIARLYERIEGLGLPGRTLWVVTSDHGEGLASHGVAGHGSRIYQEQLHVPLVLHASDGSLPARVVNELVAHVDLLPTLAETLGGRATGREPFYDGRSLWPLVREPAADWAPRSLFSQRRPFEGAEGTNLEEVYGLQDGSRKLIRHEPGGLEFFDLGADPLELEDLGNEHPEATDLQAALEARLRVYRALMGGVDADVPEEWLQELRDLGYVR